MTGKTLLAEPAGRAGRRGQLDVLLVVPPFADPRMPALGPTLLAAACRRRGVTSRLFYANLVFAAMAGHETYGRFCYSSEQFSGDALFAPYAFDLDKQATLEALFRKIDAVETDDGRHQAPSRDEYLATDRLVQKFVDEVVDTILREKPGIVGFGSMMQQNAATVTLARRIREVSPETILVIGGANATSPMGEALQAVAPMIDYVFSGEADEEFPAFCRNYVQEKALPGSKVIRCAPVEDLAAVEVPDYDEYMQQLREFQEAGLLPANWPEVLLFESSRGCWWGDRCPCAFCGVNMPGAGYRRKTRERIVGEIVHLESRYDAGLLSAADNVMPVGLDAVFDDLAASPGKVSLFYEIRPTLSPASLDALVRGGCVTLQAGVESLSSSILKKMRKGVTGLQNLVLLREAASRLVDLRWNFLLEVPGETEDDYRDMAALLPMIQHLQSPTGWGPVRIIRYSPYHESPEEFGIDRIEPDDMVRYLYPAAADIGSLAGRFRGRYSRLDASSSDVHRRITGMLGEWTELWESTGTRPRLYLSPTASGAQVIKDSRGVARQKFTLMTERALELLVLLNRPTREESIPDGLRRHLEDLLDRHFVIRYEQHLVNLVTTPLLGITLREERSAALDHARAID
jgi:ribosomal peptide maturation radical SAM protein 1